MSRSNIEIVQDSFASFATGDLDLSLYAPDFELHEHDLPDGELYRGTEGLLKWIADWSEPWSEVSVEPTSFLNAGSRVVVLLLLEAVGRDSGVRLTRREGMVVELRDGKITRVDYYGSDRAALEAAGL